LECGGLALVVAYVPKLPFLIVDTEALAGALLEIVPPTAGFKSGFTYELISHGPHPGLPDTLCST
jgi:hypothetical protein